MSPNLGPTLEDEPNSTLYIITAGGGLVAKLYPTLATPRTAACQASLSFTITQNLLKLICTESVIPSNHLILCHPLLLLPSIFPSIRVFSNESAVSIKWPEYWSFSFSISPSNEYSGFIFSGLTDLITLQSKGLAGVISSTIIQKHHFFQGASIF